MGFPTQSFTRRFSRVRLRPRGCLHSPGHLFEKNSRCGAGRFHAVTTNAVPVGFKGLEFPRLTKNTKFKPCRLFDWWREVAGFSSGKNKRLFSAPALAASSFVMMLSARADREANTRALAPRPSSTVHLCACLSGVMDEVYGRVCFVGNAPPQTRRRFALLSFSVTRWVEHEGVHERGACRKCACADGFCDPSACWR